MDWTFRDKLLIICSSAYTSVGARADAIMAIFPELFDPAGEDHAISCQSLDWGWDGIEGDSGLPCDCYLKLLEVI